MKTGGALSSSCRKARRVLAAKFYGLQRWQLREVSFAACVPTFWETRDKACSLKSWQTKLEPNYVIEGILHHCLYPPANLQFQFRFTTGSRLLALNSHDWAQG